MSDGAPAPEMRLTRAAFVSRVTDLATGWPDDGPWEATEVREGLFFPVWVILNRVADALERSQKGEEG